MISFVSALTKAFIGTFIPVFVFYGNALGWWDNNGLALKPHDYHGLAGILFMPLVHADETHLWANTISLFMGLLLLFLHYRPISLSVLVIQLIGAGILLFILGKPGTVHVGSSGVIYAVFSWLITAGLLSGNRRLRLLSFMLLMYYGSMIWGLLPWQQKVSWEGHLSGLMIGMITAILFRKKYRQFTLDRKPYWFYEKDKKSDPYAGFDINSNKNN